MIRYKDLSIWLKLGIIGGILSLVVFGISFLWGFVNELATA